MSTRAATQHHRRTRPASAYAACSAALLATLLVAGVGQPAAAVAAPAAALVATTPTAAPASTPASPCVVIVLAPYLTWTDVTAERTPALAALAERGATGDMNAVTADQGAPTLAGGALTVSAGRWAAADAGESAWAAAIVKHRAANAGSLAPPDIGALGAAVHAAGGHTAAVGSSDEGTAATGDGVQRPAELVATDREGRLDVAITGDELLVADPAAPFGVRTDLAALDAAVASATAQLAAAGGPALLVVDPGDLARAHAASTAPGEETPDDAAGSDAAEQQAAAHDAALASLDDAVADVIATVPSNATVIVVAPVTEKRYYEPPAFAPIIASGPGRGMLSSASTHRSGVVTNFDLTASVISYLGAEKPATVIGQPFESADSGTPATTRMTELAQLDTSVRAVDYLRDLYFVRDFTIVSALLALLGAGLALLLARARGGDGGRTWHRPAASATQGAILLALSTPPAAWLMFAANRFPNDSADAASSFGLVAFGVFALALAIVLVTRRRPTVSLLVLAGLTVALIVADQLAAPSLPTGLFSYSVLAGWRYYGLGNEGAALLAACASVGLGLSIDLLGGSGWAKQLARWGVPVVALAVLAVSAAPGLGANAGVAVWGVVTFAVLWFSANRVPLSWRTGLWVLGGVAALVAVLVAADVLGGEGGTHLARFATGGLPAALQLVYRKAANNLGYLPVTTYTLLALGMAGSLAIVWWVLPRPLRAELSARVGLRAAVLACVVGGAVAMLTEDSGIVMPALMLFSAGMPALYVLLATPAAETPDGDGSAPTAG